MKNIKINCSWDLNFDLFNEKQIELYVDTIPADVIPKDTIRFVWLLEPPEILDLSQHAISGMKNNTYNYVLTHNEFLLNNCTNSILFPFGTTWIKNYEFPEKMFSVSILVGGKLMAQGHHLRHQIWFKENKITKIPTNFFISGNYSGELYNYNNNPTLGNNKNPLFDSQFHICIENTKRNNWFTEKLIDCLLTKTIPIYWGCPNIGNWFNLNGFIIVDNVNDIINACNLLTEKTYQEKIQFIEENYEKAKGFAKADERLINIITNTIK